MLGFTPFKKHANKFNYIPRYYDPEKEAREQRRAELHGERAEDAGREYKPGQYIRTQREARAARRAGEDKTGQGRILKMAAAAVLVLLFIYLLYPKLARRVPACADPGRTGSDRAGRGGVQPLCTHYGRPQRLPGGVNGRQDQITTRGRCQPDRLRARSSTDPPRW